MSTQYSSSLLQVVPATIHEINISIGIDNNRREHNHASSSSRPLRFCSIKRQSSFFTTSTFSAALERRLSCSLATPTSRAHPGSLCSRAFPIRWGNEETTREVVLLLPKMAITNIIIIIIIGWGGRRRTESERRSILGAMDGCFDRMEL